MALGLLCACAAKDPLKHVRVVAHEGGEKTAQSRHHDKNIALKRVTAGVQTYCQQYQKEAIILSENVDFEGALSEKASDIIDIVGDIAGILGGKGGQATDQSADRINDDNAYIAQIKFKCQAS